MAEEAVGAVVRAKLTPASYRACAAKLRPGEVKRISQTGPLVGYHLACPACGFVGPYLHDECGFVEDPPSDQHAERGTRTLLKIERPPTCFRCRGRLSVEEGCLETRASSG